MYFISLILICGLIFIITLILNNGKSKEDEEKINIEYDNNVDEFDEKLVTNNISGNIKCKVLGNRFTYSLLYTNDNRLHLISKSKNMLEELDFNDVLDVNVEYNIKEKNRMKLISIVPTFNKDTKLESCTLKLILDDGTHEFYYKPGIPSDGGLQQNCITQQRDDVIESMERMKLLIEREIKNLNKTND